MTSAEIRRELDELIRTTRTCRQEVLPRELKEELERWEWGRYGWVSPVSLLLTAAWRKYFFPETDCCRIWASDESGKPIPGGYSIRVDDEKITIPLLAKYDLCQGFCSPNSGMQGSRAIEKMRTLRRLNRDFDGAQRTVFDLHLFASILNRTDELDREQLLELMKFYICTAKALRARRAEVDARLLSEAGAGGDLLDMVGSICDPELTKCAAAACLDALYRDSGLKLSGVEDYKTAADARAKKPGDIALEREGRLVLAAEVKDKSQHLDWNNIERAKRILRQHPELETFLFVLESRQAALSGLVREMLLSPQLAAPDGRAIEILSLHTLRRLAAAAVPEEELISRTGRLLTAAPAVKPSTKETWLELLGRQGEG